MGLHEEHSSHSYSDYREEGYGEQDDLSHKKKIRRLLEDKLERKRLRDEFKDELDDFNDEAFDWSELDK